MAISLAHILIDAHRRWPERTALVDGERELTYGELGDAAARCASALAARGVRQGDRVAIMVPNTVDFPTLYYAVLLLGATVVPVHLLLSVGEVVHVLRKTHAVVLIADDRVRTTAAVAATTTETPLLVVAEARRDEGGPGEAFDAMAPHARRQEAIAPVSDGDVAVILFTSGTTGSPKGAMLTHANLVWNAVVSARDVVSLSPEDRVFGAAPLFHSNGQTVVMNAAFCAGAAVVLMQRFEPAEALELIERERVSVFVGVPTMYAALLEAARMGGPRPPLRLAVSGAAPLPTSVVDRFRDTFGAEIYEGYGLTEASPVVTFNQPVFGRRPGSIGHPIWGLDVEIARADVDDRIELLPIGSIGEVVVRGHAVFAGYLDDAAATRSAVCDGWLRTGDLGRKDEDGFFSIAGRKKEMILRGGYNVYPREVEDVLAGHPDIRLVAVVGGPDELYGEEVHAFVVLSEAASASAADLVAWSRERLARYKYPRHVHIRRELPMSSSGKVLKQELVREISFGSNVDLTPEQAL